MVIAASPFGAMIAAPDGLVIHVHPGDVVVEASAHAVLTVVDPEDVHVYAMQDVPGIVHSIETPKVLGHPVGTEVPTADPMQHCSPPFTPAMKTISKIIRCSRTSTLEGSRGQSG